MGGVDLLAKAEEQEKLLQESNNELEERRRRAEQLRKELEEKEVRTDDSWHSWIHTVPFFQKTIRLQNTSASGTADDEYFFT